MYRPMALWSFCPLCSSRLIYQTPEGANPSVKCYACEFQDFDSPWPGTAVFLVNERRELLLLKRAQEPRRGHWDIPGGFIGAGESAEEAGLREVREELDLEISRWEYLGTAPGGYGGKSALSTGILARASSAITWTLDLEENSEAAWFPLDNLPPLAFTDTEELLGILHKRLAQDAAHE